MKIAVFVIIHAVRRVLGHARSVDIISVPTVAKITSHQAEKFVKFVWRRAMYKIWYKPWTWNLQTFAEFKLAKAIAQMFTIKPPVHYNCRCVSMPEYKKTMEEE